MSSNPSPQQQKWTEQRKREDRAARQAAFAFLVAIGAAIGLAIVYGAGGQTQLEGVLLFLAFGAVGVGLGIWAKVILKEPEIVEERKPMRSADVYRKSFSDSFDEGLGEAQVPRRRFLVRLLTGAGASLGLALLLPLGSLGPGPKRDLFHTSWGPGKRLTTTDGKWLRADEIVTDQVVTVFPQGVVPTEAADSQAVLIGARELNLPAGSQPVVDNLVCYSKVCTHAGCPVGLYRAAAGELLCPCHQSTFDVTKGGDVKSGPAGRGLPQLPIGVDDEGYLIALDDFPEPVGPAFWNMTSTPDDAGAGA